MYKMAAPSATAQIEAPLSTPKYGTLIPNRIFVGGIRFVVTFLLLERNFKAKINVLPAMTPQKPNYAVCFPPMET